jgi:hypothetical protein
MDRRDRRAVERGIELAPFARRHHGPAARPSGSSIMPMPTGSAGNISPSSVTVGLSRRAARGACTGPASASAARIGSIAPASTSLASAWVGTPKPGTSMPMMRTPLISFGSSCSGTPEAVGTHRLVTTIAS